MKILLLEEIWLGGIESPQYFPSIREALESPSYKVKESRLKNCKNILSEENLLLKKIIYKSGLAIKREKNRILFL